MASPCPDPAVLTVSPGNHELGRGATAGGLLANSAHLTERQAGACGSPRAMEGCSSLTRSRVTWDIRWPESSPLHVGMESSGKAGGVGHMS